jgi:hypothetical protein
MIASTDTLDLDLTVTLVAPTTTGRGTIPSVTPSSTGSHIWGQSPSRTSWLT